MENEIAILINPNGKKIRQVISNQVEAQRQELKDYRPILTLQMTPQEIIHNSADVPDIANYFDKVPSLTYHHQNERKEFMRQFIGHWNEKVVLELLLSEWYGRNEETKQRFTPMRSKFIRPIIEELYSPYAKVIEHDHYLGTESTSITVCDIPVSNPDFAFLRREGRFNDFACFGEVSINRKIGYWSDKQQKLQDFINLFRSIPSTAKIFEQTREVYMLMENVFQNTNGGRDILIPANLDDPYPLLVSATPYTITDCDKFFEERFPYNGEKPTQSGIFKPVSV